MRSGSERIIDFFSGNVTQIIDTLSRDGKRIIKRNYVHADGNYYITLGAAHVGVRSIGDPTPLGNEYPECKAMQEKIKKQRAGLIIPLPCPNQPPPFLGRTNNLFDFRIKNEVVRFLRPLPPSTGLPA